ncbi:hypothetical protein KUTeg_007416 [Tegillarca granosa]|uniref:Temptin Cys/Cys disulfide domain-containing protein n=1 Tax=Tegillarca granosa TaxID=220873 RepID=A0ABQ9FGI1_TEGGR|nr:hypothetical protein KUTeg_007416 [Tegillarca granosa]
MHNTMKVLVFVACLMSVCFSFPGIRDFIPNGYTVPNPCKRGTGNSIWPGVGHSNIYGRGQLNQFGMDFMDEFYTYTERLCNKDSDGDGKSNGEELGDPNCTWYYSSSQTLEPAIGHPVYSFLETQLRHLRFLNDQNASRVICRICEPMDDKKCKRKNKKLKITEK